MRISTFRVSNYKSFLDSGSLSLERGFNLVVGQNNVGKTALLEAISLQFIGKPHRSLRSAPQATSPLNPVSSVTIKLAISGQELRDILLNHGGDFWVPLPLEFRDANPENSSDLLRSFFISAEIIFEIDLIANYEQGANWIVRNVPTTRLYDWDPNRVQFIGYRPNPEKTNIEFFDVTQRDAQEEFGIHVAEALRRRIYIFRAERLNVGVAPHGTNASLNSDASNLPEVLNILQSNPARFDRFNRFVNEIFPSIYRIAVRPHRSGGRLEIVVLTEDPARERDDLAIELSESGTGVGQALAILYVAINSSYSRTIIIDEPNSFLHPAAARRLIEILAREFAHHQYIVSTHSPEIIRTANPNTLTLIKWDKPCSVLQQMDAQQVSSLQACLFEVGAKLSDVFGADNVLWVEGLTEEECFKRVMRGLSSQAISSTSIVAVRNTGDFESRRSSAEAIWEIYSRLSKGNALLPPAIGFIFDREKRTEKQMEDLHRQSGGLVRFLQRRMYENFLIHPAALAALMTTLPAFSERAVTREQVQHWLLSNGSDRKYCSRRVESLDLADKEWVAEVDASRLLSELFEALSDRQEIFRKTIHSLQLTDWLIENDPKHLAELAEFLENIFVSDFSGLVEH